MAEIWMERNPADEHCKLSLSIALKTKNQLETEQVYTFLVAFLPYNLSVFPDFYDR